MTRYALILMLLSGCETRPAAGKVAVHDRSPPAADVQPIKPIPDRTAETLKSLRRELDGLKVEVCQARVLAENAAAASKKPQDGWKPIVEKPKPKVAVDTRPKIFGITASWCLYCRKSKAELANSKLMNVVWLEFDPTRTPEFSGLPGYCWPDKTGKLVKPKQEGYLTEAQLWAAYNDSLKGNR